MFVRKKDFAEKKGTGKSGRQAKKERSIKSKNRGKI
jgi:hypothetical protein